MAIEKATDEAPIAVLLVDDDADDHAITRDLLEEIGPGRYRLDWSSDYEGALEAICAGSHDVYLIDYRLGARTGLDLIREAQQRRCFGPVILLTGQSDFELDYAALRAGAADYLEKAQLDATRLDRSIRYTLQQWRYEAELTEKVRERTKALELANCELKLEVAERQRAEAALKEVDRRKDIFIATLAHELRNPLAPIRNALEILRLADDIDARERARAVMERQVDQLVRLISDLLDVSRISQGKLTLKLEPLELSEVAEAALEMSRPHLEKAQVEFRFEKPAQPLPVQADRVRLAQIISNLLNNAAKFTEPGGAVTLSLEQAGANAMVRVQDTGIGIPADQLAAIFEPFTQADRSMNRSQGGIGIGLALVRSLAELHGGTVQASSGGDQRGAEFTVRLPLAT